MAFEWLADAGSRAAEPRRFVTAACRARARGGRSGHGARPGARPGRADARHAGGARDAARGKDRGAVSRVAGGRRPPWPARHLTSWPRWRASGRLSASRSSTPTIAPTPTPAWRIRRGGARSAGHARHRSVRRGRTPRYTRTATRRAGTRPGNPHGVTRLQLRLLCYDDHQGDGRRRTDKAVRGPGCDRRRQRQARPRLPRGPGRRQRRRDVQDDGEKTVIGRGQKAQIRLVDEGISREHAQIVHRGRAASSSQDLGSTNGTYCNGLQGRRARSWPTATRSWSARPPS